MLADLNRFGKQERRSRSQVIEMALEAYLREHAATDERIVTSKGRFTGRFSRQETYECG
jgi:metal-responsive CopG/Arc/MetJ family transcriptional regulator